MTDYEIVVAEVERSDGTISPQLPKANWRGLSGNFTPAQLRIIADQIELEFRGE